MGTTRAYKYRIEYESNDGKAQVGLDKLPPSFDAVRGLPTKTRKGMVGTEALRQWCEDVERSERTGGVNEHCAKARGFLLAISKARLIRQSDNLILTEYTAPLFRVA